eukprot:350098-Chlamydomonas_euryale.AAC.4
MSYGMAVIVSSVTSLSIAPSRGPTGVRLTIGFGSAYKHARKEVKGVGAWYERGALDGGLPP